MAMRLLSYAAVFSAFAIVAAVVVFARPHHKSAPAVVPPVTVQTAILQ
jgi:hypothetical protein